MCVYTSYFVLLHPLSPAAAAYRTLAAFLRIPAAHWIARRPGTRLSAGHLLSSVVWCAPFQTPRLFWRIILRVLTSGGVVKPGQHDLFYTLLSGMGSYGSL